MKVGIGVNIRDVHRVGGKTVSIEIEQYTSSVQRGHDSCSGEKYCVCVRGEGGGTKLTNKPEGSTRILYRRKMKGKMRMKRMSLVPCPPHRTAPPSPPPS